MVDFDDPFAPAPEPKPPPPPPPPPPPAAATGGKPPSVTSTSTATTGTATPIDDPPPGQVAATDADSAFDQAIPEKLNRFAADWRKSTGTNWASSVEGREAMKKFRASLTQGSAEKRPDIFKGMSEEDRVAYAEELKRRRGMGQRLKERVVDPVTGLVSPVIRREGGALVVPADESRTFERGRPRPGSGAFQMGEPGKVLVTEGLRKGQVVKAQPSRIFPSTRDTPVTGRTGEFRTREAAYNRLQKRLDAVTDIAEKQSLARGKLIKSLRGLESEFEKLPVSGYRSTVESGGRPAGALFRTTRGAGPNPTAVLQAGEGMRGVVGSLPFGASKLVEPALGYDDSVSFDSSFPKANQLNNQIIKLKKEIAAFDKNIEKTQGEVDTLNRALKITESTTAEEKK